MTRGLTTAVINEAENHESVAATLKTNTRDADYTLRDSLFDLFKRYKEGVLNMKKDDKDDEVNPFEHLPAYGEEIIGKLTKENKFT